MSSKKQLKKQINQIVNNTNKGNESIVNDNQAALICYKLSNGKKISFSGAIDEIDNQINQYNELVTDKNNLLEEYKKLGNILLERDNTIKELNNLLVEKDNEIDTLIKEKKEIEKPTFIEKIVEKIVVEECKREHIDTLLYNSNIYNNRHKSRWEPCSFTLNNINVPSAMKVNRMALIKKHFISDNTEKILFTKDNIYKMTLSYFGKNKKDILLNYFDDIVKYKSFRFLKDKRIGIGDSLIDKLNNFFTFDYNTTTTNGNNIPLDNYNLPIKESQILNILVDNDKDNNLPNEPPKNIFGGLVNSIKRCCK
jgi:hypothetical protein